MFTDAQLLAAIEGFLVASKMSPSAFGRQAMKDPALVSQLREGKRSMTLANANKVLAFIAERAPQSAAA